MEKDFIQQNIKWREGERGERERERGDEREGEEGGRERRREYYQMYYCMQSLTNLCSSVWATIIYNNHFIGERRIVFL